MDNATSARRTCEVCGRPLNRNNTSGLCGVNSECKRVRAERDRRAAGVRPRARHTCAHPDGCPAQVHADGLCQAHSSRLQKTGELGPAALLRRPITIKPGDVFNHWTALENYDLTDRCVLCRCKCGTKRRVRAAALRDGTSRSCGCTGPVKVRHTGSKGPYLRAGDIRGKLTVLEAADKSGSLVKCRCECGTETVKRAESVKSGHTKSCGCLMRKHGLSKHPLWGSWYAMISRCHNPDDKAYPNYGGRGITVCDHWREGPSGFLNFTADMGERPPGHSMDRVNNDLGYSPDNVEWKTFKQQSANQRTVAKLTRERDVLAAEVAQLRRALAGQSLLSK